MENLGLTSYFANGIGLKKIVTLFLFFIVAILASAAWMFQWAKTPLVQDGASLEFTIKPGSSIRSASNQMAQAGLPIQPFLFEVLARVSGKAGSLKAGSFELQVNETPRDLLKKMVEGKFSVASISIIEGWNFRQMRHAIDANPNLKHDTAGISDQALLEKIGSKYVHPEGLFFPDTYLFAKNSSDVQLYQQAHQALLTHLAQVWAKRAENLPYKEAYQALIMASIVEKETGQASERALIAAVFVNRLKVGMLLQTDPTVIYGMGEHFQGNIRKADLLRDTPYNTYTRVGLPPTPIALAGMASLNAALNPALSNAYYFVARGNGTSQFSATLDEHNRAVNKFQR
ncbi:MAG: endolytic transglycosylase MltG [Undibacterium sp.]|nr:endolytic transglycosylase MltG [Undibacterium sp.]